MSTESLIDSASRLIYLGETGHVEEENWSQWARDTQRLMDDLRSFVRGWFDKAVEGEVSFSNAVEVTRSVSQALNRLEDVYNARNQASICWPTWGGPQHSAARFDSRKLSETIS